MAETNGNTEWESVKAGMLTLKNVSVKEAGRTLSSVYSRERNHLLEPFAEMVKEGQIRASDSSSVKLRSYMRDLWMDNGLDLIPDTGQTQLYNSFDATMTNVVAVAKADKRYEDAWRRLITNLEVSSIDIKKQLGREIKVASGYNWHYSNFAELLFSPLNVIDLKETYSRDYRDYHRYGQLTMDVTTRIKLCDLFFGKEMRQPHLSKTLPKEKRLTVEDFEHETATDILTLEGVALNGSLLSGNGSISAVAVKKVKAQTTISDFSVSPGQWPLDRVELLCLTYFTLLSSQNDERSGIDIKKLAKFTVESMPRYIIGPMFSSFLPDMQGFSKSWTAGAYTSRVAGAVGHILSEAKDQWLSLDNFRMQLLCCPIEGETNYRYLRLFDDNGRRKGKPVRKADKEKGIGQPASIDWGEEIGMKFAVHWIKYLCAMGLVEIAMDPDPTGQEGDLMEGMRYARLTQLGRYALLIDTDYKPKAHEGDMGVEFDAQNSILTIDRKSPYQMFLDRIATRISPTRFRISSETLLKGCRNASELDQRTSSLQTIIDPDKEPAIKAIIEDAKRHTYCATRDGGYSLLRIRPDLPGLREMILTNKELREMTILAGPTMALVKTHKMERFNAICASYGYLMD